VFSTVAAVRTGDAHLADARGGWIRIAGLASVGAGAIHAAAIGGHSEHRQAVWAFTAAAAFQIGVGVLALVRPHRVVAVLLGLGNAALIGGWLLAKTSGIGFVEGLGEAESVQLADGLAASLAGAAVVGSVASVVRIGGGVLANGAAVGICGLAVALLAVPAMASVGTHAHGGDHGNQASGEHGHGEPAADHAHAAPAATPPQPFDPTQPIDLGGVEGVSPEQEARAEALVERTIERLPQFGDVSTLNKQGYYSIGDAATGDEHYINWSYLNDDKTLDPDAPESLVFRVINGEKTLAAAMYMLPEGTTLDDVPDLGGPLTQWHVHNDLCLTDDPIAPTLAFGSADFLTGADQECTPPNSKRGNVPMIHVWITPHPCGPFAALEGIGAGQIRPGEERLCDHAHGSVE